MVREGYYEGSLATLHGTSRVVLELAGGTMRGLTTRGAELSGRYDYDETRRLIRYELMVTLPAHAMSITGHRTADQPETVTVSGEASCQNEAARFSLGLAGRAVDVVLRYVGPVYDTSDDRFPAWPASDTFFSATS
jgi:hypothetical protein